METSTINRLGVSQTEIADLCRRHHIRKLALFGSVLRGKERVDSDVDLLVEFEPGIKIGWAIVDVETSFSDLLGRRTDLRTAAELSRYFRDEVVATAEVLYERS